LRSLVLGIYRQDRSLDLRMVGKRAHRDILEDG
jgi:hypothetical protein